MTTRGSIHVATTADAVALAALVNSAYRGEGSKKGWTTEADLLDGQRTDEANIHEIITTPGHTILKYTQDSDEISGCVYLQSKGSNVYLGMLTVSPALQGQGIGKALIAASEAHARSIGAKSITMTVISVRAELIAWYGRHGYLATGATEPFPEDPRFGLPKQALHFIVLEKMIQ